MTVPDVFEFDGEVFSVRTSVREGLRMSKLRVRETVFPSSDFFGKRPVDRWRVIASLAEEPSGEEVLSAIAEWTVRRVLES